MQGAMTMTNPDNSVKKVVSTEYVDKKPQENLNAKQVELQNALQSYSTWDEFEAELTFFRGKGLKMALESHNPYFTRNELKTKSLKLDDFILEA